MTKKEIKTDNNKFMDSLVHLPLISSIACLLLLLLFIGMYFSKIFHLIIIIAMGIATALMFYAWWKSR